MQPGKKHENPQQVVTRMQDLASEFSKIFRGSDTPGPLQREEATPSRTQHPARPLAGHGAQAPQCWDPNLGSPQLFSRDCAPERWHVAKLILDCWHRIKHNRQYCDDVCDVLP